MKIINKKTNQVVELGDLYVQSDGTVSFAMSDEVRKITNKWHHSHRIEKYADHCQCEYCIGGTLHKSDCAVHNEPAEPRGRCSCGATEIDYRYEYETNRGLWATDQTPDRLFMKLFTENMVPETLKKYMWKLK